VNPNTTQDTEKCLHKLIVNKLLRHTYSVQYKPKAPAAKSVQQTPVSLPRGKGG
jgi:hypothetical protein